MNAPLFQGSQPFLFKVPIGHLALGGTRKQAESVEAKSQQLQKTSEATSFGPFFQAAISQSWIFKMVQLEMQLVLPA